MRGSNLGRLGVGLAAGLWVTTAAGAAPVAGWPEWDIAALCGHDSASGQCALLEREARRTLSGGWDAVPPEFRSACLAEVKSPYDKSYRLLSSCLEHQVLKGLDRDLIDTATTAPRMVPAKAAAVAAPPSAATAPPPPPAAAPAPKPAATAPAPAPAAPVAVAQAITWPYLDPSAPAVAEEAKVRAAIAAELAALTAARQKAEAATAPPAPAAAAPVAIAQAITWPYVEPSAPSVAEEAQRRAAIAAELAAQTVARQKAEAEAAKAAEAPPPAAPPAATPPPAEPAAAAKAIAWPYLDPADAAVAEEAKRRAAIAAELMAAADARAKAEAEAAKAAEAPPPAALPAATPPPAEPPAAAKAIVWPYLDSADAAVAEEAKRRAAIAAELMAAADARAKAEAESVKAAEAPPPAAPPAATPPPAEPAAAAKAIAWPYLDPADAAVAEEAKRRAAIAAALKADADARAKAEAAERQAAEAAAAEALAAASRKREAARACQSALDAAAKSGVILFKSGLAVLEAKSTATLDRLAAAARSCGNLEIRIAGHTDATGAADRNQKLSEDRARAVADYLAGKGVPAAGLKSAGFGATRPIAPNDTPAGRAKNRRIEFTVSTE